MRSHLIPFAALMLLSLSILACTLASGAFPAAPPTAIPADAATLPPLAPGTIIPTRTRPTTAATATLSATYADADGYSRCTHVNHTTQSTGSASASVSQVPIGSRARAAHLSLRIDAKGNGVYPTTTKASKCHFRSTGDKGARH
jgi:hypothetical protein